MPAPITTLRYLKRENLQNEAQLQKGYFREIIHSYGVDVQYFRLSTDYFESPSGIYSNYTYGESTCSPYTLSASMIVFMNVNDDSPMLRKFGIETATNAEIYFMKEDFTEQFRDIIGTPTSAIFSTIVSADISNFSGILAGEIIGNDLSGITSAYTEVPSGVISGIYSSTFDRYPKPVVPLIAISPSYTDRIVLGDLTGIITGEIDLSGNGYMNGNVSGLLQYFVSPARNSGPNWKIAPQVGDFIRLSEFDEEELNFFEYEITEVLDKDLTPNGVNPHIKRYIWKCSIVRRDPSNEIVSGTLQEEKNTPHFIDENNWHEIKSNRIFDYSNTIDNIDKQNELDSVYGGYGNN